MVQGDCFSRNTSVVLHSEGRLDWTQARRRVVEAPTYSSGAEQLLDMIQALCDIETRRSWAKAIRMACPKSDSQFCSSSAVLVARSSEPMANRRGKGALIVNL